MPFDKSLMLSDELNAYSDQNGKVSQAKWGEISVASAPPYSQQGNFYQFCRLL